MASREETPTNSSVSLAASPRAESTPVPNPESSMMELESAQSGKRSKPRASALGASKDSAMQSAGKIRHLKKEDGEPLWRRDIQYDFLVAVFGNEKKVFTNNYEKESEKQNFADLYIDTMARSSKTSKVLRDKLLSDREAAKGMAMVCLLVNLGRMNTTLNFFPEMRAQLRTYHAIPSLQAHQDASAYKQLQDAPRLKSILKGAAEDRPEPHELGEFKERDVPRTNPVNLIFLLTQHAAHVAELHFPSDAEFHDLIMKTTFSSKSRANAFLWLMWQYLESDFTEEGCEENPFGAGVDYGNEVANQGVPNLIRLTLDEEAAENNDPDEEKKFGEEKQAHRAKIIAADQAYMADHQTKRGSRARVAAEESPSAAILPRIRPSKHDSDRDSTRSTPPPRHIPRVGGNSTGRRGAPLKYQIFEASSPAGPSNQAVDGIVPRKPRPPTAHQLAVERNRNQRVEYILDRGLRKEHHKARKLRRQGSSMVRMKRRLDAMDDPLVDSDDDECIAAGGKGDSKFKDRGFGGLCPLRSEPDDFGEEFESYAASLRRTVRRLRRWSDNPSTAVVPPFKKRMLSRAGDGDVMPGGSMRKGGGSRQNDDSQDEFVDQDELDDVDRELLGLSTRGDDDELDDVDKTLLGIGGGSDGDED